MLPTLGVTGNLLLVERISTQSGNIKPGDVVIFRSPEFPRKTVCKRLIGMEGDQVTYVVDPKNSDRCETIVVFSLVPNCSFFIFGGLSYCSVFIYHLVLVRYLKGMFG